MTNSLPQEDSEQPAAAEGAAEVAEPKRIKALVVEDDFACRVLLHGLLSKYGECHIALNGAEAISAFEAALKANERYDLICMDIQMPEMDGHEAVTKIREIEQSNAQDTSEVKILMTTSLRDLKTVFQSFGEKCDDYLVKPVEGKSIAKHLRSFGLISH